MVTGGSTASAQPTSVELLFMNGTRLCSLPNLPEARKLHSQSGNIICGGEGGESREEAVPGTRGRREGGEGRECRDRMRGEEVGGVELGTEGEERGEAGRKLLGV